MQQDDKLKEALNQYKKENFHIRNLSEYEVELKSLVRKVVKYIKDNNLNVDAVIPILRGGNVPATFLAYALDVLLIIPVQYKYFFIDKKVCELRRIISFNTNLIKKKKPVFLLVEGNHCYGNQAKHAASDLKDLYPNSKIIYAASNMDYNHQTAVKDASAVFYGRLTNDCKELSKKECIKLKINCDKDLFFPWENIEEEWEIVELKQHKYNNLQDIYRNSSLVETFNLS